MLTKDNIISFIDEQLRRIQQDLVSSPDSTMYWILQGEAHALKELKGKLNEN